MINDSDRKEVGRIGEDVATRFLIGKGFKIIARNYRKPWGEIDIIARDEDVVVFVEVKANKKDFTSLWAHLWTRAAKLLTSLQKL